MNISDGTLVRKLAIVLVLKIVVLVALWAFFVRDERVKVDGDSIAAQFFGRVSTTDKGSKK
jgi:hypothetical protein